MNSLRVNWFVRWCGVVLAAGALALAAYAAQRHYATRTELEQRAEVMGAAVAAAWSALAGRAAADPGRALVAELGGDPQVAAVAVLAGDGRILAAQPPLPRAAVPATTAGCAACHGKGGPPGPLKFAEDAAGRKVVHLFRRLGGGAGPLLYLTLSVDAPYRSARTGTLWVLALGGSGLLLLAGLAYGMLRRAAAPPPDAPATATDQAAQEPGQLAALAAHIQERGLQVQMSLARLREGVDAGRSSAAGIMESVNEFDSAMAKIRVNLNAIAESTSDNSTSLTQMSASVDEVARNADQLAQHVSTTASSVVQMVQSVLEVADRVELLAKETDATASSMAQIDASTRQIEQNAREATDLTGPMAEAARDGSRAVGETLEGIHASYGVIRETAKAMEDLTEASKAIGDVVKIINEINDKTKLLSLNAAIIAAQAGEHGKSFAVVAHEIKNLSDRTAASTGQISKIIRGIRERIEVAREAVKRGEDVTAGSVGLAEKAKGTLERILSTAQVTHDMTREILRATEEQSRGSRSVMASMQEVSTMVGHIRRAAQEHRSTGEHVSASTESMHGLTEQVKLATAEQAEVSRYLSEAVAAIDRNLQDLLQAVDSEREETEKVLEYMTRLKARSDGQENEIQEVEAVIDELQSRIAELEGCAAELEGNSGEAA